MTFFSTILHGLGLSYSEVAEFLKVRPDTIKGWAAGRRTPPAAVLAELRGLADQQQRGAQDMLTVWRQAGEPKRYEIGVAADNRAAATVGWPSVGAQMATFYLFWQMLPAEVELVLTSHVSAGDTDANRIEDLKLIDDKPEAS